MNDYENQNLAASPMMTKPIKSDSPMQQAIIAQTKAIYLLGEIATDLKNRLSPLLVDRPASCAEEAEGRDKSPESRHVGELKQNTKLIHNASEMLRYILENLEV